MIGIEMSERIRFGSWRPRTSSAAWPLVAVYTVYPEVSRMSRKRDQHRRVIFDHQQAGRRFACDLRHPSIRLLLHARRSMCPLFRTPAACASPPACAMRCAGSLYPSSDGHTPRSTGWRSASKCWSPAAEGAGEAPWRRPSMPPDPCPTAAQGPPGPPARPSPTRGGTDRLSPSNPVAPRPGRSARWSARAHAGPGPRMPADRGHPAAGRQRRRAPEPRESMPGACRAQRAGESVRMIRDIGQGRL